MSDTLRTFKSQLRGTRFQIAVRSTVAKLAVDFYKDVFSERVENYMK